MIHGSRYLLIKRRPATMSVKLVSRAIKLGVTSPASIDAFLIEVVILPSEGRRFRGGPGEWRFPEIWPIGKVQSLGVGPLAFRHPDWS